MAKTNKCRRAAMMSINELHGAKIRKQLGLDCAFITRKVKTEKGGDFEMYLITRRPDEYYHLDDSRHQHDYQLNGYFDADGVVYSLAISRLFHPELCLFRYYKVGFDYKDIIRKISGLIKDDLSNNKNLGK